MADLFVSHARADDERVNEINEILRVAGIETWLDHLDLEPGSRWNQDIQEAIKICECGLVILSQAWLKSVNCENECLHMKALDKKLYVVVIDEIEKKDFPWVLEGIQYIDLSKNYHQVSKLTDSIKKRCCFRRFEFVFDRKLSDQDKEKIIKLLKNYLSTEENPDEQART
jgi:hypothetical protein